MPEEGLAYHLNSLQESTSTPREDYHMIFSEEICSILLDLIQSDLQFQTKNIVFGIILNVISDNEVKKNFFSRGIVGIFENLLKSSSSYFINVSIIMANFMFKTPPDVCNFVGHKFIKRCVKRANFSTQHKSVCETALFFICHFVTYVNYTKDETSNISAIIPNFFHQSNPFLKEVCYIVYKLIDRYPDYMQEFAPPMVLVCMNNFFTKFTPNDLSDKEHFSYELLITFQNILYYPFISVYGPICLNLEEVSFKMIKLLSYEGICVENQCTLITILIYLIFQSKTLLQCYLNTPLLEILLNMYENSNFELKTRIFIFINNSFSCSPNSETLMTYLTADVSLIVLQSLCDFSTGSIALMETSLENALTKISTDGDLSLVINKFGEFGLFDVFASILSIENEDANILAQKILDILSEE